MIQDNNIVTALLFLFLFNFICGRLSSYFFKAVVQSSGCLFTSVDVLSVLNFSGEKTCSYAILKKKIERAVWLI